MAEANVQSVSDADILQLLTVFAKGETASADYRNEREKVTSMVINLWKRDYVVEILKNKNENGDALCSTYPEKVIIPIREVDINTVPEIPIDPIDQLEAEFELSDSQENKATDSSPWLSDVRENLQIEYQARAFCRFPAPAILYEGKYICRSSTISIAIETYARNFPNAMPTASDVLQLPYEKTHRNRLKDVEVLRKYRVSSILDLMVEKDKLYLNVSFFKTATSEKVEEAKRYKEFTILSFPYPGCEHFVEFTNRHYISTNMPVPWESSANAAYLKIINNDILQDLPTRWANYESWDFRTITSNYLNYLLDHLKKEDTTGLLIHCVCGWDRTPIFIALLRLTLWAEGVIHKSLNYREMLFLTLGYDWFLFGHQYSKRLQNNINLVYFCFEFLDVLIADCTAKLDARSMEPCKSDNDNKPKSDERSPSHAEPSRKISSEIVTEYFTQAGNKGPSKKRTPKKEIRSHFDKENSEEFSKEPAVLRLNEGSSSDNTSQLMQSGRSPLKEVNANEAAIIEGMVEMTRSFSAVKYTASSETKDIENEGPDAKIECPKHSEAKTSPVPVASSKSDIGSPESSCSSSFGSWVAIDNPSSPDSSIIGSLELEYDGEVNYFRKRSLLIMIKELFCNLHSQTVPQVTKKKSAESSVFSFISPYLN